MPQKGFDRNMKFSVLPFAFVFVAAFSSVTYATNGYFAHGYGTKYMALAGAGSALSLDALASATNPGALAFLGNRYDISLAVLNPNSEYTVSGTPSGFPGTFGLTPGRVESDTRAFLMPALSANWKLDENISLGLALFGHGYMNTKYPTDTFHGSSPTGVNLMQIFLAPTLSVRIAQDHGIGMTPIFCYQVFKAEGLEEFSMFSREPAKLTNKGNISSSGFGIRIGYMGEWSRYFSVGASYQTKIDMTEFDDYAGLFAEQGDFDIPANWTVGIAVKPIDGMEIVFDIQQILYSKIKSIRNPFSPSSFSRGMFLGDDAGPGFGWENMTIFKGGMQWQSCCGLIWRTGFSFGKQPIPASEVLFNILSPAVVERHLTYGFTRALGGKKEISLAIMHAISKNITGANPMEVPGLQSIELKMNQWQVEVSFSF